MPIRRITVEVDDSGDTRSATYAPTALVQRTDTLQRDRTQAPTKGDAADDTESPVGGMPLAIPRLGRTWPDLFHEMAREPKVVGVVLMFLPFPFFAEHIKNIETLVWPMLVGMLLNVVWGAIATVQWFVHGRGTKKKLGSEQSIS